MAQQNWLYGHGQTATCSIVYVFATHRFQNLQTFLFKRSILRREPYDTLLAVD